MITLKLYPPTNNTSFNSGSQLVSIQFSLPHEFLLFHNIISSSCWRSILFFNQRFLLLPTTTRRHRFSYHHHWTGWLPKWAMKIIWIKLIHEERAIDASLLDLRLISSFFTQFLWVEWGSFLTCQMKSDDCLCKDLSCTQQ